MNDLRPAPSQALTTRSERADAITVLIVGLLASVVIIGLVSLRALQTFRSDGIGWILPIDQQPIEATVGSGVGSLHGYATEALVIAPNVNVVSIIAIALSHAVFAAAALTIVGGALWIAWSFLRGRFFARGTVRALAVISWALALAPALIFMLDTFGRNGVLAALSIENDGSVDSDRYWSWLPLFSAGVALGLVTIAFRRGARLQMDTEGLV